MQTSLVKEFQQPGSLYRGKPFWAWNGPMEPEELQRQIRLLKRMGFGGFFMHARVGLATGYLSAEWFKCVKACLEEAKRQGMEAWLYDEDRWPSGFAGGLVTKDERYRMRTLAMEELDQPGKLRWDSSILRAYLATIDGHTARNLVSLTRGQRPKTLAKDQRIIVIRTLLCETISWYNNYCYLDTLNPEAVREFIRVTHETYRKNIGAEFGKLVPGIFTDEPFHGAFMEHYSQLSEPMNKNRLYAPWTDPLPDVFQRRYGYDIREHLAEIFFDVEGQIITSARRDFHDCVTHMFVEAFAKQIGQWCEKNKLQFTGHVLHEENLHTQTMMTGSPLRFYEHMQAPGMDQLTEYKREYHVAKQVSSAARQFGRQWRLTEAYGCTGWDFPFRGYKALGDWQAALGINLRCPHLSWYTMEGEAKRDYPAGIFYQSPWWEQYRMVEDYFARLHVILSRGQEVRDLLMVHPNESMWLMCRKDWLTDPAMKAYEKTFAEVRDRLLAEHLDFDYGDEDILARHSQIKRTAEGPILVVGKARYRAVVVPPLLNVRQSTLDLLAKFTRAGGQVTWCGPICQYVDSQPSTAAQAVAELGQIIKVRQVAGKISPSCRRVSITDGQGAEIASVLYQLREDAAAFYLFICNTGKKIANASSEIIDDVRVDERQDAFADVIVKWYGQTQGSPVELDARTGEMFAAGAKTLKQGWQIRTSLARLETRLFVLPKKKEKTRLAPRPKFHIVKKRTLNPRRWSIGLTEHNVVVLDQACYKIGDSAWQKTTEILRIDRAVRARLGLDPRGGEMVQPWAREKSSHKVGAKVCLWYHFDVAELPSGELHLAVERPDCCRIKVNGWDVATDVEAGWWTDRSLKRLSLNPEWLRLGTNTLEMEVDYDAEYPGLEMMYLLGSFGVKLQGQRAVIESLPQQLRLGNWVRQGLPFYAGSVTYYQKIKVPHRKNERVFVRAGDFAGAAVQILVNGQSAGVLGWEPYELDITDLLDGPEAMLGIQVVGHRRNSHGPLHLTDKHPIWVGPGQFITEGKDWSDAYQLVSCGLLKPPQVIIKK